MRKKPLFRTWATLLLAVVAAAWVADAYAAVTVNVRRTDSSSDAPYIYAWVVENGDTTILTDTWPGTQMSATVTDEVDSYSWYTKSFAGYSSISVIINDNGNTQTSDLTVPMHLSSANASSTTWLVYNKNGGLGTQYGNAYVDNLSDKYDIPGGVTRENGKSTVYFVNTNNWSTPCVQYHDDYGNWYGGVGEVMTKVGTNSNGWDVYKAAPSLSFTPTWLCFNNNGSDWSSYVAYNYHGYYTGYDYSCLIPEISSTRTGDVYNNAYYFSDANMRAAIADATGVPASTATTATDADTYKLAPSSIKVLDLSNRNISTLNGTSSNGIEKFTGLEELYAQGNSIASSVNLQNSTSLRILNISNNSAIKGFSTSNAPYVNLTNLSSLKELYCSNCSIFYAGTLTSAVNLEKLVMDHNVLDYFSYTTMSKLTKLKYVDMSYNKLTDNQDFYINTALEYIDVSHNPDNSKLFDFLDALPNLHTFKASDCKLQANQVVYSSSRTRTSGGSYPSKTAATGFPSASVKYVDLSYNTNLAQVYVPATNNLETLIVNGCTGMQGSSTTFALGNSTTYVPRLTHLKHLEFNNAGLYLNGARSTSYQLLHYLPTDNLEYIDFSSNNLGTYAKPTFNCPKLDTLLINNNPALDYLAIQNNTTITPENINITGDVALAELALNNMNLPSRAFNVADITGISGDGMTLSTLNYSNVSSINTNPNSFAQIPAVGVSTVTTLKINDGAYTGSSFSSITNAPSVRYLSLKNNSSLPASFVSTGGSQLLGLDLSNNTQFITLNLSDNGLQAVMLSGCTALDSLNVSGNNLQQTCTAYDENKFVTGAGGASDHTGGCLYITGDNNLRALDISHNIFRKLGHNSTLSGMTNLTHLYGHHNKFSTFSNADYTLGTSGNKNYRKNLAKRPSLEALTALKHLDLSYNELRDSVHLYRNTELEWLNVSHNRAIIGSWATEAEYKANSVIRKDKGSGSVTFSFPSSVYDPGVYNDTVGLRMLDLIRCNKLKYLDVSYTCITQTASPYHLEKEDYMNNWAHRKLVRYDGTVVADTDDDYYGQSSDYEHSLTSNETKGNREPHFMRIWGCPLLETLYADYNGLKSIGIGTALTALDKVPLSGTALGPVDHCCPALTRISIIQSRGQDPGIMQGNLSIQNPNLEYYDVSYSDFDLFRVSYNSSGSNLCPNLKYLNVSGNFTKNNALNYSYSGKDVTRPINHLFLEDATSLVEVKAVDCPYLQSVHVSGLTDLTSLDLSQGGGDNNTADTSTRLTAVYAENTGLPFINMDGKHTDASSWAYRQGEEEATSGSNDVRGRVMQESATPLGLSLYGATALTTLYADSNADLETVDVSDATALQTLHASGNAALVGTVGPSGTAVKLGGTALQVLRLNNAGISGALSMSSYASLDSLEVANLSGSGNMVSSIDVSSNASLRVLDFSNASKYNTTGGNRVKSITLAAANSSLTTVKADNNNLFSLTMPSSGTYPLATLSYAHNHINGIDLSHASGSSFTHVYNDNGRYVVANTGKRPEKGNFPYLQLTSGLSAEDGGTFIGNSSNLGSDGFVVGQVTSWTGGTQVNGTQNNAPRRVATASDLDASSINGTIIVLEPSSTSREVVDDSGASTTESYDGTVSYSYDTDNGSAEYYLDYTWDPSVITGIDELEEGYGVVVKPVSGGIEVSGLPDGAVVGVFDMAGRSVAQVTVSGGTATIDNLAPGIYIVNGQKVRVN